MEKKSRVALNILFIVGVAALLFLLVHAPKETTTHLPKDDIHLKFYGIASKKEAERSCGECHGDAGSSSPLPANHPPPYRCLFCHKR